MTIASICPITVALVCAAAAALCIGPAAGAPAERREPPEPPVALSLENEHARYQVAADGDSLHLIDKRTGVDYCAQEPRSSFAVVKKEGRHYRASAVSAREGRLTVSFGDSGISAVIAAETKERYFTLEVVSVTPPQVEELAFANLTLTLQGSPEERFACCALALNLQTNVPQLPGPSRHLWAACYPRFGFAGAKVALIACSQGDLRQAMREVVAAAPDLPRSPLGGPWALGPDINQGSYLFNFSDLTERTVGEWIDSARAVGFDEIDFHGGHSFRFGDFRPNPELYPDGYASLKAVIDRLHESGIKAGLHTYAFFIDKSCPWVTPVPDPRLGKDATFTLAATLSPDAAVVPVVESTENMSAITGFAVRNSVTLQIDDELITYSGVAKDPPYAFTGCQRGACGTRVAAHGMGAKVYHLRECFHRFAPDPDSTLFTEVAAKTAEIFNECGFDMIYLDALDGEDVLGGPENGWHYGSKFAFEVWRGLERPALMEMSTFHHHLWYLRSRMGAWDHPNRSHKRFIDLHCAKNEANRRMFMPGQLGWWAVKTWSGPQEEPTFADDIEYLCCKALGTDTGLALMGVDPNTIRTVPAFARLAGIFRRYERLRHADYFPESIKERLRVPGDEFTLLQDVDGRWRFRPVRYDKHKVAGLDGWSTGWRANNEFGRQPVQLRIEALLSAGPYDAPGNLTLADFADPAEFAHHAAQEGVEVDLQPSTDEVKAGAVSGRFTATSTRDDRRSSWAVAGKAFDAPLDAGGHQALGVWVHGDGQGELLNLQVRSPEHVSGAIGEHYITVDFTGWRYFELIEPEGARWEDYSWPYGWAYSIYRELVDYRQLATVALWYNDLPPGEPVACRLSPIKALPLVNATLRNPSVSIGGETIVFPVEMETGSYLEFRSADDCKLYDPTGKLIRDVRPQGETPTLAPGDNEVTFTCDPPADAANPRAYVTVISQGEPLGQ